MKQSPAPSGVYPNMDHMKNLLKNRPKVFVAMSGGVDSSVAAALLQKQGFRVVGVFFKPWQPENGAVYCNWQQDRLDAMRVASILGIPFKTWDFSKEYGRKVAKYMIDSYRKGTTPNPDVMCNKEIKFGLFLERALAEGADYIATGHYARMQAVSVKLISNKRAEKKSLSFYYDRGNLIVAETVKLLKAKDRNKDQSYFLWTLTQKQLKYCLFPIGDYTKPEVRRLAKKFGLPNHDKKDSQGVCFVGPLDMKDFLKSYIRPKTGEIRLLAGDKAIGRHDGVYYYTIGQRHGLNITDGGGPYYVVAKDIGKNIIYVADSVNSGELSDDKAMVAKVSWVSGEPELPLRAEVKIRYRAQTVPALVIKNGSPRSLLIKFAKPVRAITPGQSAVFYRGEAVLGGGVISSW